MDVFYHGKSILTIIVVIIGQYTILFNGSNIVLFKKREKNEIILQVTNNVVPVYYEEKKLVNWWIVCLPDNLELRLLMLKYSTHTEHLHYLLWGSYIPITPF